MELKLFGLFQPVYRTIHTLPTNSSNQYTAPSTHHLQTVPTSIPHCPHITYRQFQPVYHTIHTSPTNSSDHYTTPSTHHLHTALKLTISLHHASFRIEQSVRVVVMYSARFLKFVIKADSINKTVINRV